EVPCSHPALVLTMAGGEPNTSRRSGFGRSAARESLRPHSRIRTRRDHAARKRRTVRDGAARPDAGAGRVKRSLGDAVDLQIAFDFLVGESHQTERREAECGCGETE